MEHWQARLGTGDGQLGPVLSRNPIPLRQDLAPLPLPSSRGQIGGEGTGGGDSSGVGWQCTLARKREFLWSS